MGRKQIKRKNHQRLQKKSKRVQKEKHSPLLLFEIKPISFTTQVKPTYKVSAKKRKIYNNTYRLKCKGYRVEPHKHTIYAYDEGYEHYASQKPNETRLCSTIRN